MVNFKDIKIGDVIEVFLNSDGMPADDDSDLTDEAVECTVVAIACNNSYYNSHIKKYGQAVLFLYQEDDGWTLFKDEVKHWNFGGEENVKKYLNNKDKRVRFTYTNFIKAVKNTSTKYGYFCSGPCGIYNEYAIANSDGNKYICYSCRN